MTSAVSLTLAGAILSLAVVAVVARKWWAGKREIKELVPFAVYWCVGGLMTICVGGLFGWGAGLVGGLTGSAGDVGVEAVTGQGSAGDVASGSIGQLTPEGACAVVLIALVAFAVWKAATKEQKKRMTAGLFCGMTLCGTAGIAGLMTWLPNGVNAGGSWIAGALGTQGIL